jgi:nicotinamidase-related amidase
VPSVHPHSVKAVGAFQEGEWGGAIVDALTPKKDDIVVKGKSGICCFASTNLDFIIRQRGIETVAIGGFLTK